MAGFEWRRREVLVLGAALVAGGALPARALEKDAAIAHVNATIDMVIGLLKAGMPRAETAAALRRIFEERTALPQIARFCAGRYWGEMDAAGQARFTEAFAEYLSFVYAGHFSEYDGDASALRDAVTITGTIDGGAKGVLVKSEVQPQRQGPVAVDWLISDRSGRVAISDLVVVGISLAVTQRETVQGMFEKRGGDLSLVIADLESEGRN